MITFLGMAERVSDFVIPYRRVILLFDRQGDFLSHLLLGASPPPFRSGYVLSVAERLEHFVDSLFFFKERLNGLLP